MADLQMTTLTSNNNNLCSYEPVNAEESPEVDVSPSWCKRWEIKRNALVGGAIVSVPLLALLMYASYQSIFYW